MPDLTVKALAELIHLPMYEHLRILAEQKYPGQIPAVFRVPFYGPALAAVKTYYRSGRDLAVIDRAIQEIRGSGAQPQKIDHNVAVLQEFRRGTQRQRDLALASAPTYTANLAGLGIRFRPDVVAAERGRTRYLIYNFRILEPSREVARTTVELAHHVLDANGVECRPSDLEFISLRSGAIVRTTAVRANTLRRARQSAQAIIHLWDTI